MDWAKAKNALIIIFIVLNIFLLANLTLSKFGGEISRDTISYTLETLKNRGVELQCEIPAYNGSTGMLGYENWTFDKEKVSILFMGSNASASYNAEGMPQYASEDKKLTFSSNNFFTFENKNPDEKIDITKQDNVVEFLKKLTSKFELPLASFEIDRYENNPDNTVTITMRERYKKMLIYDNYVKAVISENGVTYLDIKYKKIKSFMEDGKSIPAYQAILSNFTSNNKTNIISIDYVFINQETDKNSKLLMDYPAWRVGTSSGDRFFGANDGGEVNVGGK